jgi:outer membrane lipoprotein SlyB
MHMLNYPYRWGLVFAFAIALVANFGSTPAHADALKGAVIGAGVGALVGGKKGARNGAIIGAVAGGVKRNKNKRR